MTPLSEMMRELQQDDPVAIRDPLWKHIWLSKSLHNVAEQPSFRRLSGILQLGPTIIVYPGASHTRFAHSLGVFQVAKRFLERFAVLPSKQTSFFTREGVRSFLAAALLHDLGHFPYTHSFKELALEQHESLSARIIREEFAEVLAKFGALATSCAAIIDHEVASNDPELLFFRKVLSGALDPDKLDYLNRDAYYCGVPYGMQDLDFLLSQLTIVEAPDGFSPALSMQGLSSLEHVLFAKYLMYRAVYWNKHVRTATAMIKKAVFTLLKNGKILPEQLYRLDDTGFFSFVDAVNDDATRLVRDVAKQNLFHCVLEAKIPSVSARFLSDLEERNRLESAMTSALSPHHKLEAHELIIDVPEAVSFESHIPVVEAGKVMSFAASDSVFGPQTIAAFTQSLRKVRVFVPARVSLSESQSKRLENLLLEANGGGSR